MAFDLDHALRYLIAAEGSDLHLKVPSYPLIRLYGRLEPIPDTERLYPEDTERALAEMLGHGDKLAEFESENEVDFSYAVEGLGRFRVNAFRQRGSISIVMRAIPAVIKSVQELGQPEVKTRQAQEERGIILLPGTTASGSPSSSTDLIVTGMARMTIEIDPRCMKALTRKRPRPSTEYEKSTSLSASNSCTFSGSSSICARAWRVSSGNSRSVPAMGSR